MKILMISYNPTGRGTFFRAYEFARELVSLNQSVTIMSTAPTRRSKIVSWEENGIHLVEFPALFKGGPRSGWDPLTIFSRLYWLPNKDYDIVHGFESRPTVIYPALALKRKGVPLVLDWCDWFGKGGSVEERPDPVLRTIFRPFETFHESHFRTFADATTVICSTLFQRALSKGVSPDSLALIPNGLNMPGWKLHLTKDAARKELGFTNAKFIIGYVGSLFPKDAVLMSRAFNRIHQQFPQAHLLHIGQSNYLPDLPEWDENTVTVTGSVDEEQLQTNLAACDVCWLPLSDIPANQGRFPLKFSTYLTAGKPTVVTNVGDVPDYVRKYQVGLVAEPDADSLAGCVLQLVFQPDMSTPFEVAAKRLSQDPEHSWHSRAKALLDVYRNVISSRSSNK